MTFEPWPGPPEPPAIPLPPEVPYPYPPLRPMPRRTGPVAVPMVDVPSGDPIDQLRARRRVLVSGTLDAEAVTGIAAELMALDGRSADDVELIVKSDGGPLAEVLVLLDIIGSMRAKVATSCLGRARGTAAVLVAAGTARRRAAPNAMLTLRCEHTEQVEGPTDEVRHRLEELVMVRRQVVALLARATGRPADELDDAIDHGSVLDATGAKDVGLVDVVG